MNFTQRKGRVVREQEGLTKLYMCGCHAKGHCWRRGWLSGSEHSLYETPNIDINSHVWLHAPTPALSGTGDRLTLGACCPL